MMGNLGTILGENSAAGYHLFSVQRSAEVLRRAIKVTIMEILIDETKRILRHINIPM